MELLKTLSILFLVALCAGEVTIQLEVFVISPSQLSLSWGWIAENHPTPSYYFVENVPASTNEDDPYTPGTVLLVVSKGSKSCVLTVEPYQSLGLRLIAHTATVNYTSNIVNYPFEIVDPQSIEIYVRSNTQVYLTWEAFADPGVWYYEVEALINFPVWKTIGTVSTGYREGQPTSHYSFTINPEFFKMIPGFTYYVRVIANTKISSSISFATSAVKAMEAYNRLYSRVAIIPPTTIVNVADIELTPIVPAETLLGGYLNYATWLGYTIPPEYSECEILYASLTWENLTLDYSVANGGFFRAYPGYNELRTSSDPNGYFSSVQLPNDVDRNSIPLEYITSNYDPPLTAAQFLNDSKTSVEQAAFLLTLQNTFIQAPLHLANPNLTIAFAPHSSLLRSKKARTIAISTQIYCLQDSIPSYTYRNNTVLSLDESTISTVDFRLVYQISISFRARFFSNSGSPQRLSIGFMNAVVIDTEVATVTAPCSPFVNFTAISPPYPLQSGGLPGFDYANVANNRFTFIYSGSDFAVEVNSF